jgi:hypothetical protein
MKTRWIETEHGYIAVIESTFGDYEREPLTYDQRIAAAFNYMVTVHRRAMEDFFNAYLVSLAAYEEYVAEIVETWAVLNDPETMEAIEEAQHEEDISRWEGEGGAIIHESE